MATVFASYLVPRILFRKFLVALLGCASSAAGNSMTKLAEEVGGEIGRGVCSAAQAAGRDGSGAQGGFERARAVQSRTD